jgi:hypothetical protein
MVQPYIVNVDAVNSWWQAAINTCNEQMQHLVDNNDEAAILKVIEDSIRDAIPDGMSEEMGEEFIADALEAAKDDPGWLVFGRFFAEIMSDFMNSMGRGDFREVPGTTIKILPLTNSEGKVRGVEISRSQMDDSAIQEIASNGISGIEDFLNSRVNNQ